MRRRAALLAVCLLAVWYGHVLAAAPSVTYKGITLSPAIVNLGVDQNLPQTDFKLSVTNNSNSPVSLNLSSLDFKSLNETGGVAFIANGQTKYGLANWLILPEGNVNLAAHVSRQVDVTVDNRADLSPGGHYAAVLFKNTALTGGGTNPVDVNQVVAALVFLKKTGGEVFSLQAQAPDFGLSALRLPDNIDVLIKNSGNTQTAPRGVVTVTDPRGHEVRRGIINADSGLVLPESTRLFRVALFSERRAILPGTYKATISYEPADTRLATTVNYQFFYASPFIFLALLVVLAAAAKSKYSSQRRRQKN